MGRHPLDALYRRRGIEGGRAVLAPQEGPPSMDLAEMVTKLAELPLLFSPGSRWSYSVATDVCGHLVERLSGQPFDAFLQQRIFGPLRMVDTGFAVPADQGDRLAACYVTLPGDRLVELDAAATSSYREQPTFLSGGGGLVSTASDYLRFALMLLERRRAGRPAGPRSQDGRVHDDQPPAHRRRPGLDGPAGVQRDDL